MILDLHHHFPNQITSIQILADAYASVDSTIRLVGGTVRDAILNKTCQDIDIATPLPPQQGLELLKKRGIPVKAIGIKHGTITAILQGVPYEITTLRRDVTTDGRYAQIAFTDSWAEDAKRRDLTMNGLTLDLQGHVHDDVNGLPDILSGTVRFIGPAQDRIAEDYLRILRLFRFYAHYGKVPLDTLALQACQDAAPHLRRLSRERIRTELLKLLQAPHPDQTLEIMHDYQVIPYLDFGDIEIGALRHLIRIEKILTISPCPWRRFVACFPKIIGKIDNMRPSKIERHFLNFLSQTTLSDLNTAQGLKIYIHDHGKENTRDALMILCAQHRVPLSQTQEYLSLWQSIDIPPFPLTGKELAALGFMPGVDMGVALKNCRDWWLRQDYFPNAQDCLAWIKNHK